MPKLALAAAAGLAGWQQPRGYGIGDAWGKSGARSMRKGDWEDDQMECDLINALIWGCMLWGI